MNYNGQYMQDKFLNDHIFKNMKNGFFLEMGAADGLRHSNTYFFEQNLGWNGICIEPREADYLELVQNRKCICENICISDSEGEQDFLEITGYGHQLSGLKKDFDERHVKRINKESIEYKSKQEILRKKCTTINKIFEKHSVAKIDYFSLDIEGGELKVLKSIDFSRYPIQVVSVENNYNDKKLRKFMEKNNYEMIKKIHIDEIYVRKDSGLPKYKEKFSLKTSTIDFLKVIFNKILLRK